VNSFRNLVGPKPRKIHNLSARRTTTRRTRRRRKECMQGAGARRARNLTERQSERANKTPAAADSRAAPAPPSSEKVGPPTRAQPPGTRPESMTNELAEWQRRSLASPRLDLLRAPRRRLLADSRTRCWGRFNAGTRACPSARGCACARRGVPMGDGDAIPAVRARFELRVRGVREASARPAWLGCWCLRFACRYVTASRLQALRGWVGCSLPPRTARDPFDSRASTGLAN
jgi:hypothetical protein